MATKTNIYELKGNPVIKDIPIIGNLVYDEAGKEVLTLHNERFRGIKSIEDTHEYREGQPISYSNVPRALSFNQILRERFPDMRVLSPEEVVNYWDAIPERNSTYADTNSIAVYPNKGLNEDLRLRVLGILGKSKIKTPLMISGLGVERADNTRNFTFTETDYTNSEEAPYLEQDGKVSYSVKGLVSSKKGVIVVTSFHSGLRGLCRFEPGLDARDDYLLNSGGSGRVQIIQNLQGCVENLEAILKQIQKDKDN